MTRRDAARKGRKQKSAYGQAAKLIDFAREILAR